MDNIRITPAALSALVAGDMDNFLVALMHGGIEAQEKRGQSALVNSAMLPVQAQWDQLTQIGIVRGDPVDDLFVNVTLPAGWTKRATEHNMWSDLLDEQGRKRAAIFYKAAFYDRSAHMTLERRYSAYQRPVNGYDDYEGPRHGVVLDQDSVIWQTEQQAPYKDWPAMDAVEKQATAWLDERYPDWRNPLAYW